MDRPQRATFSSPFAAICATAGVAIGLGNIWRFPYMMGRYGGAVFLLAYVLIMAAFAVPALMAEWVLGRHARRGTWQAFQIAGMPGARLWSGLLLLTVTMAASYYGVVIAWVLQFAMAFAFGATDLFTTDFTELTGRVPTEFAFVVVTVSVAGGMLLLGVRRGIQRASMLILPLFFALFAVLVGWVLSLDGALGGLKTLLVPRWADFDGTTLLAALGQAFFSLGLGGTFMVAYGSYLRQEDDIPRNAVLTAAADVAAALMAGLIIVPASVAFGVQLESGPALRFDVLPRIFDRMQFGGLFGAIFFASIVLVALLSLMAAYEVLVAAAGDALGWSRRRALAVIMIVQIALATPALLIGPYVGISDLVWGSTMQPVGGALAVIAATWCIGRARTLEQLRAHTSMPVPSWLFIWMKFVIPIGIAVMLAYGWIEHFRASE